MKPRDPLSVEWTRAKIATLAAGVGLYAVCMALPLVGPAGVRTEHAAANAATFLALAAAGGFLSLLAWRLCRKDARSGKPAPLRFAAALTILHALFVTAFFFAGF